MSKTKKTRLCFTLALAKHYNACSEGLDMFLKAYPNTPENKEINILKLLESNNVEHIIWALRCTITCSKAVSVELARRCAARTAEREKQKQDLLELLEEDK